MWAGVGLAAFVVACGGGSTPTTTAMPSPTPPPTLTGVWEGTLVERTGRLRTFAMTLSLTQAVGTNDLQGTVTTRINDSQFVENITAGSLNGLNVVFQTVIYLAPEQPFSYLYTGSVDPSRTTMAGSNSLVGYGASATWSVHRSQDAPVAVPSSAPPPQSGEISCEGFVEQPSYSGDCAARPANTTCVGFSDGYIWVVSDGIIGWEDHSCSGPGGSVRTALGVRGAYHHILFTRLVKSVPR